MKRLITLSGPVGRAILTLGEEIKLSSPCGTLFLADKQGKIYPKEAPPADIIGAFVVDENRIIMQGSLAGYSSIMAKARTALLMSLSIPKQPAPRSPVRQRAQANKDRPAHPPQPQTQRPASAALLEILQKAAELFPPEPSAPPPPPERNDAIVNPFPEAFPFSRWRRVEYPGTDRCYLEGEARHKGVDYLIHALPGDRRHSPPGYNRFLRARDGSGFWVRVRRK